MKNHGTVVSRDVRVLIVDLSKRYGGASTRAIALAQYLSPWHVAIAGVEDSPVVNLAKEKSIPVKIVAKHRADPRIPFRLAQIIRKENFQVIDTQNIQSKFWSSLAALLADVAFVSTLNSSYESEHGGSLKGKLYQVLDLWTNWKTDRYVAVSEAIRRDLLAAGIPESAVDLIHNSVEVDESAPSEDRQAVRARLGIPQDAFLCVLVGRLVWAKGYDDFIPAFSAAANLIPKAYAVIAGDGELFSALSDQIKQADLAEKVLLLGFCNKTTILGILKAGDIYVMPSRSEGIPFALLEAAALGLPIVATNCGGIPEVVTDKVDSLLVPVGDRHALSSALITLHANRDLAEEFGRRIKEKIKGRFAPAVQVDLMRQAYQNALSRRISRN